jgi:hypothetical protein
MQPGGQVSQLSNSKFLIYIGLRDGKKNLHGVTLLISLPFHNVRIKHKENS